MALLRALFGYATSFGNKRYSVWPHAGPTSYTRVTVTAGTVPATGGDSVPAVQANMSRFDKLEGGQTDDGAFTVRAIPVTASFPPQGAPSAKYILQWISNVTATIGGQAQTAGVEAVAGTNLSAEIVRLSAVGPE
jgi:hypothetical protein